MGLDSVELVMRVEESFDIVIEDADAEQVSTPGQMCALIERKLGVLDAEKSSFCPTSRAFYRVRRELMGLGIGRAHIKPDSSLHELLPRANRVTLWRQLSGALPLELAPLGRSDEVRSLLLFGATGSALGVFLTPLYPPLALAFVCSAGATIGLALFSAPHKIFPPSRVRTVAELARRVAWTLPVVRGESQTRDVWLQLQLIIADELSIAPEKVTRDAHFFRDLGMG